MQSYDPNQQSQSHDGYFQNQQRISLPPASSFFGHPPASADYHHSNTPQSEPPPSPYLSGQYNQQQQQQQPQSYSSTGPNTPYIHQTAISPPNYSIGPSTSHYIPPPQPPQPQMQQQMYNSAPQSQVMDSQGYGGIEQHHPQQQQQQQPMPHQMQMGYHSQSVPNTPMISQDPHAMQMGYMDQGIISNYPPPQQHQGYLPPSSSMSHHQMPPTPMMHHQIPRHQQQQHHPQLHHSLSEQNTIGQHHSEMSNNSILRNHLRPTMQQDPPPSTPSMESIVSSSSSDNMSQILQMQQRQQQQHPLQQQQHLQNHQKPLQSQHQQQQQEREVVTEKEIQSMPIQQQQQPPPPSSNYMPHSVINQEMMDHQRGYVVPQSPAYPQPHSIVYPNPMSNQQNYQQQDIPMRPLPLPQRQQYHDQRQISQEFHHQPSPQASASIPPSFPSINEPSISQAFHPQKMSEESNQSESSIAETVAEVIAKQSAKIAAEISAAPVVPSPPPPKKRRNIKSAVEPSDGPTVRQHLQAKQDEKKKQEQEEKIKIRIKEDEEKRKFEKEKIENQVSQQAAAASALKGPGMTRTEFLQAHRQRKVDEKESEKDTVVRIIEEIATSGFPDSNQPSNQERFADGNQILESDQQAPNFFEEPSDIPITPAKPKPKRIRKKPPQKETKVQQENKQKFLFKALRLQRTIRSLVLQNSALADETSRLFYRIKTVTEERKMLAKRVQHFERNRIRRIQTQKKKRAKAEAQLAQTALQEIQMNSNYPPSVEYFEPEVATAPPSHQHHHHLKQEKIEVFPYENMVHKEMTVYLPPMNQEEFARIPYLEPPFEDYQEPLNSNGQYSNVDYGIPMNYEEYPGEYQNYESHHAEMNDSQIESFFEVENDEQSRSHIPYFGEQEHLMRFETSRNSSSAASSRPESTSSRIK